MPRRRSAMARAVLASTGTAKVRASKIAKSLPSPCIFRNDVMGPYRARKQAIPGLGPYTGLKPLACEAVDLGSYGRKMPRTKGNQGIMRLGKPIALMGLVVSLFTGAASLGADITDDPYIWLEEIQGEKPLQWVKEQNVVALKQLKADPDYQKNYDSTLAVLDATDRIPTGQVYVSHVFNFWQDEAHVRGIWRRATIASYETASPDWETLVDVDAL